jgi:hypothetical protein
VHPSHRADGRQAADASHGRDECGKASELATGDPTSRVAVHVLTRTGSARAGRTAPCGYMWLDGLVGALTGGGLGTAYRSRLWTSQFEARSRLGQGLPMG